MQEILVKTLLANPQILSSTKLELKETHISWILIGDEFVYKIKKAVDFGFLNFTNLLDRKKYCQLEVELNTQMGASFYLNSLPIYGKPDEPTLKEIGTPIEYCVKMKKFNEKYELSFLEQKDELSASHILELVEKLANWHSKAPIIEKATGAYGTPDEVKSPVMDNFSLISNATNDAEILEKLTFVENWAESVFSENKELFQQRYEQGMIKSCHGDLHLANVVIYEGEVMPFDCIEFNLEFRYIDVINDLAFLLMDLDAKNRVALSNLALSRYLEITGDYQALPLVDYYKSYRAMVRAKVNFIQMQQTKNAKDKAQAQQNFLDYLDLAKNYTEKRKSFVAIVSGVSGSGKSTLSFEIAKKTGALRISSDTERKRLFGLKEQEVSNSKINDGIYTKEANAKTYKKLQEITELCIKNHYNIILDATFLKINHRKNIIEIAEKLKVDYFLIGFKINEDILKERIKKRLQSKDFRSEANLEVLQRQLEVYEPFTKDELKRGILLDLTDKQSAEKVFEFIKNLT